MLCNSKLPSQTFEKVIELLFLLISRPEKMVHSSSIPLMQLKDLVLAFMNISTSLAIRHTSVV